MGPDAAAEEQFGPYLVYERLGVGGMATVHRALERGMEGFERVVALKRLLPHLAEDSSFIKAFVREAKLASLLNHNNIVHIFELGRVASHYFISMEYIDGRDIRRILRQARIVTGPPAIHVTVGLLLQLCDALDYAHHKVDDTGHPLGLVHRDVSPSNVLVTSNGELKVIDFGIAKAQGAQRTQTGRVKGKLAYMAPEALSGKELDARSDLFAVGVIAHELLTARPLFASKNEYQTLLKVQRGEIMPPSTFNQQCPPELDAIVLRALARDPDQRFADANDLRDELHAMRKQYNLATSQRDVATWIDWAFGLDRAAGPVPAGPHQPARGTPRPIARSKRTEDDEAVDLAWGSDDQHHGEPVVIDDVPDVSAKHFAANPSALGAEVRLDLDDLADDIPTPLPSHGSELEPDSRPTMLQIPRPSRAKQPSQQIPVQRAPGSRPPTATRAPTGHDGPGNAAVGAGVRSVMMPPRVRTITIPPRMMPTAAIAPRNTPPTEPPRVGPSTPAPPSLAALPSPAAPVVPRRPVPGSAGRDVPSADPSAYESNPGMAARDLAVREAAATERTLRVSADDLGLAGDTMQSMPALQSSEPIVRFREPTLPPPIDAAPQGSSGHDVHVAPAALPGDDPFADPYDDGRLMPSDPATEPTPGRTPEPMPQPMPGPMPEPPLEANHARSLTRRRRLITPATALFAEPEPDSEGNARAVATSGHGLEVPEPHEEPVNVRRWVLPPRMLIVLVALALLGAAATLVTWYLTRRTHPQAQVRPQPTTPPTRTSTTIGTIHFVTVPADSAITISGRAAHAGSPWDAELAFGVHQVEIHHDGYKGWLTSIDVAAGERQLVHVELEPLGSAMMADATLIVVSSPPGLDAVLDGVVVARTPIKLAIKPGTHSVTLRRNGVDVWKKGIDAGAGTTYELRPLIPETTNPTNPTNPANPANPADPARGSAAALEPQALPQEGEADAAFARPDDVLLAAAPSPLGPITLTPAPAPPPAPAPTVPIGPVSVAPSAVSKLSGPTPNVTKFTGTELPPRISAKLCIDPIGHVASAELLTPVASDPRSEIIGALREWRYAPYKLDGVAHAACFAVAFRVN